MFLLFGSLDVARQDLHQRLGLHTPEVRLLRGSLSVLPRLLLLALMWRVSGRWVGLVYHHSPRSEVRGSRCFESLSKVNAPLATTQLWDAPFNIGIFIFYIVTETDGALLSFMLLWLLSLSPPGVVICVHLTWVLSVNTEGLPYSVCQVSLYWMQPILCILFFSSFLCGRKFLYKLEFVYKSLYQTNSSAGYVLYTGGCWHQTL